MSQMDKVIEIKRRLIEDERGWFLKAVTGLEEKIQGHIGEVYLTMGKPGQAKGGHYHPLALEWFTVVQGAAILKLEDVRTHERRDIHLSLSVAKTVFVPNNVAHVVVNEGDQDFILLAYTDRQYDPADTIAYEVR